MPPQKAQKRKAVSQVPDDDDRSAKTITKRQQTNAKPQPEKVQQDFGSAFASLLAAPTPVAAPIPSPQQSDKKQPTSQKPSSKTASTVVSKSAKDTKNTKAGSKDKETKKESKEKDSIRKKKDQIEDEGITGQFNSAKNKRQANAQQAVITVTREDSEKQRLAKQFSKLQKSREKEKQMLFEKDHVRPQYDDTEKQLTRIATKGVVALFQAVYDQTQKMKELQDNKNISGSSRDKLINDEVQSGFLELLQQASETTAKSEAVYVPSSRKKITDLKTKLKQDDDLNWNDLKSLGLNLSDDDDNNAEIKAESISTQVARNMTKNGLGAKHMQQDSSSDSDDDENAIPKFRRQALQRQKEQKAAQVKSQANGKSNQRISAATDKRVVGKWNVLDDDYVQTKSSGKMKDWENDDTSDSDL